jgi:tRNA pseudouridine13 synthase
VGEPDAVRDEQWQGAIKAYRQGDLTEALRTMPRHCRTERDVLQRLAGRPDDPEKAFGAVHPRMKKLYLSAFQSYLFDKVVEQRIEAIDRVMAGDLAWKHVNGACFLVEDPDAEAPRAAGFEISASGPMFGCRMKQPAGEVLELEQRILEDAGISSGDFDSGNKLSLEGERRPLRFPLDDVSYELLGEVLQVEFSLPRGCYATSVIREITKTF